MQYAQISFLFAQLVLLVITSAVYLRLRQHGDKQGQDVAQWSVKIEGAIGTAQAAMAHVDKIDTEHYRTLKSKYEALALEFDDLKRSFRALEERYERMKLDRAAEAKAASRAAKAQGVLAADPWVAPAEDRTQNGAQSLDDILHREGIPLSPNGAQPQPTRRPGFGEPAH